MSEVSYAVEGPTDEPVAERIITRAGHEPRRVLTAGGKVRLDARIPGYNRSARHLRWLVVRDLDQDDATSCIPDLRRVLVGGVVAPGLALRFAVRSVEAWLLADIEGFSQFFGVRVDAIPRNTQTLPNPKLALVGTCRRSRRRAIREGVVPRAGSGRVVGPEYTATIREFVDQTWDIDRAATEAPSLARAIADVQRIGGGGG